MTGFKIQSTQYFGSSMVVTNLGMHNLKSRDLNRLSFEMLQMCNSMMQSIPHFLGFQHSSWDVTVVQQVCIPNGNASQIFLSSKIILYFQTVRIIKPNLVFSTHTVLIVEKVWLRIFILLGTRGCSADRQVHNFCILNLSASSITAVYSSEWNMLNLADPIVNQFQTWVVIPIPW